MFYLKAGFAIISFVVDCGLLQRGQNLHPRWQEQKTLESVLLYSKRNQMRMFHVKSPASVSSFFSAEVCTTNYQLAKPHSTWHFNILLLKVLGLGRVSSQCEHSSNFAPFKLRASIMQTNHALSLMCASMCAASVRSSHACDLLRVTERPQPPGCRNILRVHTL